jgi:hypothetical protein
MYEVDENGTVIWGPYNAQSQKGFRYECDYPGIIALESYMNTATTSCFNATAIDDESTELQLTVYPNPTNSAFTIEFNSITNSEINIEIYNTLGKEIFNKELNSLSGQFKERINLEDFSEGIYFVNIISSTGQLYTKRICYIK